MLQSLQKFYYLTGVCSVLVRLRMSRTCRVQIYRSVRYDDKLRRRSRAKSIDRRNTS